MAEHRKQSGLAELLIEEGLYLLNLFVEDLKTTLKVGDEDEESWPTDAVNDGERPKTRKIETNDILSLLSTEESREDLIHLLGRGQTPEEIERENKKTKWVFIAGDLLRPIQYIYGPFKGLTESQEDRLTDLIMDYHDNHLDVRAVPLIGKSQKEWEEIL